MSYNIKDYTPFREGKHPVFSSSENGCRHIGNNVSRQYIRHFKIIYHTGSHNVRASDVLRWKAKHKVVIKGREYSENI